MPPSRHPRPSATRGCNNSLDGPVQFHFSESSPPVMLQLEIDKTGSRMKVRRAEALAGGEAPSSVSRNICRRTVRSVGVAVVDEMWEEVCVAFQKAWEWCSCKSRRLAARRGAPPQCARTGGWTRMDGPQDEIVSHHFAWSGMVKKVQWRTRAKMLADRVLTFVSLRLTACSTSLGRRV